MAQDFGPGSQAGADRPSRRRRRLDRRGPGSPVAAHHDAVDRDDAVGREAELLRRVELLEAYRLLVLPDIAFDVSEWRGRGGGAEFGVRGRVWGGTVPAPRPPACQKGGGGRSRTAAPSAALRGGR